MLAWWTEQWSIGSGQSRIYCGIAVTDDGFAVDVFHGDTCVESEEYGTRAQANAAAHSREVLYRQDVTVAAGREPHGTQVPLEL